MAQRVISFLVVWLLMFSETVFSQEKTQEFIKKENKIAGATFSMEKKPTIFRMNGEGLLTASPFVLGYYQKPRVTIFPTFYYDHSGFFCQREMDLQRISRFMPKIRLGLIDDVDWMERKPNAVKIR
jgi:hypothetical protein